MKKLIIFLFALFLMADVLVAEEKPESKVEEPQKSVIKTLFSTDIRQKKGEEDKKLFFTGNFNFAWFSGNINPYKAIDNNYFDIGFDISTKWDNNITKAVASYKQSFFSYPIQDEETRQYSMELQEAGTLSLHLDHYIANRWELFTFADTDRDDRLLLNCRFSAGSGIKFVIFRNEYWILDFGVAPVFELTSYRENKMLKEFRLSGRTKTEFVIYEFVRIGAKFFYIPNMLSFPDDYRYSLENYLAFYYFLDKNKTQSIVIQFTYKRMYNSVPKFDKVFNLDQYVVTSIGVNF